VKLARSDAAVGEALARLAADAGHAEVNLMPAIFDAVRAYATVGEMINTLATVFGRWEETAVI
jgi:methylmalonyl-CoA mutase N-terminal domain/subunit